MKKKLNSFLLTPTAFAYNVWVGQKSKLSGDKPEEWGILFLKRKGVMDPNIDLFLGILANNEGLVKSALDDGADPARTDEQLIEKYKDELRGFGQ